MADFCKQCSIDHFGEDMKDLANLGDVSTLKPGEGWTAICEGCGLTVVNNEGECILDDCSMHGTQTERKELSKTFHEYIKQKEEDIEF